MIVIFQQLILIIVAQSCLNIRTIALELRSVTCQIIRILFQNCLCIGIQNAIQAIRVVIKVLQ